jgi:hypothetical protein
LETFTNYLSQQRYKSLEQAFDALRSEIDRKLERDSEILTTDLKERLEKLRHSLRSSSCGRCKAKHQLMDYCLPNEKTYAKVSAGGECIEPVKALCSEIYNWVTKEVFWPRDDAPGPVITLATTHQPFQSEAEIIRKFAVSGWASVVRGEEANTAVGIYVREHAFGWEQYCLLPYLLLHEIVCHGLQSLDGRGPRCDADPDDAWSEGWMDRLAYRLARQWLEKAGGWILTPDDQDLAVKQSIDLHDARYETVAGSVGPLYGREVFDKVQQSYGAPTTDWQLSTQPITQLSLRLNACTLSKDERLTLLERFDTLATTDRKALHGACAKFIAHRNVNALRTALG